MVNDREATIENIIARLEKLGMVNQGDSNAYNGQVKTMPNGYVYEIKEDGYGGWEVTYIGNEEIEIPEILISLKTDTSTITNQIEITMVAKADSGIKSYTEPMGTAKTYSSSSNEVTETYIATSNGTYTFTIVNNNGETETQSITINNILTGTINLSVNKTTPTNDNVVVTVVWPTGSNGGIKEVKVGDGSWQTGIGSATEVSVAENCVVQARVRNSTTEIITSNLTISNIDKTNPTVTTSIETAKIIQGDSNDISTYFNCSANGIYGIDNITYTNITDGNETITNTDGLTEGTYVIRCIATKETGAIGYADKKIVVKNCWDGQVNTPQIVSGMIPVYYESGAWKKADTTNQNATQKWYSYTEGEKRWANVVTVGSANLTKYQSASVGTTITQSDITAMFVWIPRYSYTINGEKDISINFLQNRTNKESSGSITSSLVHPVFTNGSLNNYEQGGWDEGLTGYWVAKFEASGVENGNAVGNGSASQYDQTQAPTASTYVRILPNVISWRYITIGEAQYRSMQMSTNTTAYGWTSGTVDTHLIKNDEWGGVAYLCYSKYGEVPMTNGAGVWSSTSQCNYNFYTGAGPYSGTTRDNASENGTYAYTSDHAYNTDNGVLASTTGNVYGIYDMAGGNWERVAGYLDNGNRYLGTYGKSTTDTSTIYFAKNADKSTTSYDWYDLKDEYQKYWCRYEVGEEEKSNKIKINDTTTLTQNELWNTSYNTTEYNAARLRITAETYNKMANYKGIGVNEMATSFSYYGVNSSKSWNWFTDATQPNSNTTTYGRSWDSDLVLIGHACIPFVGRGGGYGDRADAGVLCAYVAAGNASYNGGFRPALVPSTF